MVKVVEGFWTQKELLKNLKELGVTIAQLQWIL